MGRAVIRTTAAIPMTSINASSRIRTSSKATAVGAGDTEAAVMEEVAVDTINAAGTMMTVDIMGTSVIVMTNVVGTVPALTTSAMT